MDYDTKLTIIWWTCAFLTVLSGAWILRILIEIELNKSMLFDNKLELSMEDESATAAGNATGSTAAAAGGNADASMSKANGPKGASSGKMEAAESLPADELDDPENKVTPIRRRRVSRSFKIMQISTVSCLVFINYLLLVTTQAPVWLSTIGMACVLSMFLRFQIGEELRRRRVDRLGLIFTLFLWIAGLLSLATYATKTYKQGEIYEGPARIVDYDQTSYMNSHNDPITRSDVVVEFGDWWACPLTGSVCRSDVQGVLCQADVDGTEEGDEIEEENEEANLMENGGVRKRQRRQRKRRQRRRRVASSSSSSSSTTTTTAASTTTTAASGNNDASDTQSETLEQQNEDLQKQNEELQKELDDMKQEEQEVEQNADEEVDMMEDEVANAYDEEDAVVDQVYNGEMDENEAIDQEMENSIDESEAIIEEEEDEDLQYVKEYDDSINATAAQEQEDVAATEEAYDEYEEEVVEDVEDEYEEQKMFDDDYGWEYNDYTTYIYEDDYYEDAYWDYDWDGAWGEYGCQDLFETDMGAASYDSRTRAGEDDWPTIQVYGSCKTCNAYVLDYFAEKNFKEVQFYKTQAFLHFAAAAGAAIFTVLAYLRHRVAPTAENEIELLSSDSAGGGGVLA